jgi:hypothetical protein
MNQTPNGAWRQATHTTPAQRRLGRSASSADMSDIRSNVWGVARGNGLYTSTWEPTITVRLRGSLNDSAMSAACRR